MNRFLLNSISDLAFLAPLFIAIAFSPVTSSCSMRVIDASVVLNDFQTEGFLDPDHFQVIVRGTPDPVARGLVARRESALRNAESAIPQTVADAIGAYRLDHLMRSLDPTDRPLVSNLEQVSSEVRQEALNYVRYGRRAFEYYNEDHSAVIVFRIYRSGLRKSLESGGPRLELPEPSETADTSPPKG